MNKSEQIGELAKALSKVQGQLTPAKKDSENPFFRTRYADLNSVWDSCRTLLTANGLSVVQTNEASENGVIVETVLLHESGEWISGSIFLPLTKHDPQGVGSAITYGRRYGLASIIGIVADEDDDGNAASANETKQKPAPKPATNGKNYQAACQSLAATWVKAGEYSAAEVVQKFLPKGKTKFEQLTDEEAFATYKQMTEGR